MIFNLGADFYPGVFDHMFFMLGFLMLGFFIFDLVEAFLYLSMHFDWPVPVLIDFIGDHVGHGDISKIYVLAL